MINDTSFILLSLILLGFLSVYFGILNRGDERVLSKYVYNFALPSLFFLNISSINITSYILKYVVYATVPIFILFILYFLLVKIFNNRDYILLGFISSVFGSFAFYGIPYIELSFPNYPQGITVIMAGFISISVVVCSIYLLELREHNQGSAFNHVLFRFSKNPLIISILLGVIFSVLDINLPVFFQKIFKTLSLSASPVAIFMLGVFFYGKKYDNLRLSFSLVALRFILVPTLAIVLFKIFDLSGNIVHVTVLLLGMPSAIALMVLSERYNFYKDTIASLILFSSLIATFYLPILGKISEIILK